MDTVILSVTHIKPLLAIGNVDIEHIMSHTHTDTHTHTDGHKYME